MLEVSSRHYSGPSLCLSSFLKALRWQGMPVITTISAFFSSSLACGSCRYFCNGSDIFGP